MIIVNEQSREKLRKIPESVLQNSGMGNDLKLNVYASTIKKFSYSDGYHCRSARRKPLNNSVNKMTSLLYAISYKNDLHFWNKEVFTD